MGVILKRSGEGAFLNNSPSSPPIRVGDIVEHTGHDCPTCGSAKFQGGPSGGNSQNIRCENGHCWNINAFGWASIEPPAPPAPPTPTCLICGCTEQRACPGGCSWVHLERDGRGVCSACESILVSVLELGYLREMVEEAHAHAMGVK